MPETKTPFGKWLAENNQTISELPDEWHSFARRLSGAPHKIATNSPTLAAFAVLLKQPLETLQKFAKGKLMTPKFVKKIEGQLAAGIHSSNQPRPYPGGRKAARGAPTQRKEHLVMPATTAAGKLLQSKGQPLRGIAEALGLPPSALWRISGGKMPPNHPQLAKVAEHVGVPVAQLAKLMTAEPLGGSHLARALAGVRKAKPSKPGTAVVLASRSVDAVEPRHSSNSSNGGSSGSSNGGGGSKYNRIRKADLHLRQVIRDLVGTLNVEIMKGHTHIPPLPVGDLYLILQDYLQEKGIREIVLVDPSFASVFDPR